MAVIVNERESLKNEGIEIIRIYPDESKDKNATVETALEGDTQLMKDELAPMARHFQNIVRKNRAALKEEAGVLTGKMFNATDALRVGLIDKIGTLTDAVNSIKIKSIINQIKTN
jgi:protease-4